mmetsp:Transcript_31768/g.44298  ORF Transcript_31768/g.44298 Transcript_31768/m.44298 type:complete len:109 (-) Transcript_31768:149-475(-)
MLIGDWEMARTPLPITNPTRIPPKNPRAISGFSLAEISEELSNKPTFSPASLKKVCILDKDCFNEAKIPPERGGIGLGGASFTTTNRRCLQNFHHHRYRVKNNKPRNK